jgi:hypothetical protein
MKFSYSAIWNDTVAMLRAHGSLMLGIAGAFIFFPTLLFGYLVPPIEPAGATIPDLFNAQIAFFQDNAIWLVLIGMIGSIGSLAILDLLLARGPVAVDGALGRGIRLLGPFYVATILTGLMTLGGFILFILPGLYLYARFLLIGPVMVGEGERGPIAAIRRSFDLTRGRGWAVLGLVILVAVTGYILMSVVTWVVGAVILVVANGELARLLLLILNTVLSTILSLVILTLTAAIYRALVGLRSDQG